MMITYIFACTLLVHTSHSWVLQTTHKHVQLNGTSNVTLHCRNNEQGIRQAWMEKVSQILIFKDGSWLAQTGGGNTYVRSDKRSEINATAHINLVNDSYLSLTWNQVSADTLGRYQCRIGGADRDRNTVLVNTNTVVITEEKPPQQNVTKKSSSQAWPGGKYALLKPYKGCPDATWTEGFVKIHAESTDTRNYFSYVSRPNYLAGPLLTTVYDRPSRYERNFVYIRTCKHISENDDDPDWPKGNYCIHRVGGSCPSGFSEGAINIDTENYLTAAESVNPPDVTSSSNGDLQLYFCCRKDGPRKQYIDLPVNKSFYLYRLGRSCQWVNNMYSTEGYLTIDTENTNNSDSYSNDVHPDSQLDEVSLDFCYYEGHT